MEIYKYKNYKEYKESQTYANKKKIERIWTDEITVNKICEYIATNMNNICIGICHGVRNGFEVKKFRECLKIEVIGTEISDTANRFPNVIEWDFHNVKDEWIENIDFIYSNSLDHSYDPEFCLKQWVKCLKKDGKLFLDWDKGHNRKIDKIDCFSASKEEYLNIISKSFLLEEVLTFPISKRGKIADIFVIKNKL